VSEWCAVCGREGYLKNVGDTLRVVGHLDQRIRHSFELGGSKRKKESNVSNSRRVVRYIPIEEGANVDFGDSGLPGISGAHKIVGYQPAPLNPRARKPYEPHGWLVYLVNEDISAGHPRRLRALRKVG
jgi:hypothetical protein